MTKLIWLSKSLSSIVIFLLKSLTFSVFCWILSIEFFIKLRKTLLNCSLSLSKNNCWLFWIKSTLIVWSNSCSNLMLSFINIIRSFFWNTGFGILAKSENSLTNFSICLIWLLIIFKFSWKFSLFFSSKSDEYLFFNLSIVNWIGVKGFLISWASFLARLPQASCLSLIINLSCWSFNRSIIWLKFLFNIASCDSVKYLEIFLSKYLTIYKNLLSKFWRRIIAADLFSKALIIFNGRSSSNTRFKAWSNGGR